MPRERDADRDRPACLDWQARRPRRPLRLVPFVRGLLLDLRAIDQLVPVGVGELEDVLVHVLVKACADISGDLLPRAAVASLRAEARRRLRTEAVSELATHVDRAHDAAATAAELERDLERGRGVDLAQAHDEPPPATTRDERPGEERAEDEGDEKEESAGAEDEPLEDLHSGALNASSG